MRRLIKDDQKNDHGERCTDSEKVISTKNEINGLSSNSGRFCSFHAIKKEKARITLPPTMDYIKWFISTSQPRKRKILIQT